jgi:hypothetical protein
MSNFFKFMFAMTINVGIHWHPLSHPRGVGVTVSNPPKSMRNLKKTPCRLQTECILDKTEEYRRDGLLCFQRMPPNRIHLKLYHYKPQGRRTIVRLKKLWREQL